VIVSPLVLTEVDHLAKARFGSQARDAVNVALAAQYRTDAVLTLDRRDFARCAPSPRTSGSDSYPTICSHRAAQLGP
jgi:predicted nucleic acid-binding protein